MIKAPYNFVPLADKVVFPSWASDISIDRPFEDGISGTIDVEYTAQTPVFIGNGKGNDAVQNYKSADGKYAIPGSSLRGMIRNVAEIVSFGKFSRVSDVTLSVRDLQRPLLYSSYLTIKSGNAYEAKAKAGWLIKEDKEWILYPVNYHRVEDSLIESCYGLKTGSLKERNELERRIKPMIKKVSVYFKAEGKTEHRHHGDLILKYSLVEELRGNNFSGASHGFTVLTGQPGRRYSQKQGREMGKHLDFVFEDKSLNSISLDDDLIRKFRQANAPSAADQKKGLNITDKLVECKEIGYPGIPVFYLADDSTGKIESLGLSQMYRLPYKNNLHDAIEHSSAAHLSEDMDFAECIFGKISNEKNMSLRGRVQFEDATADSVPLKERVDTILGNPKPTFYPNYIEQDSKNSDYKTLMDADAKLRGWKRYPVKNNPNPVPVGQGQDKLKISFSPLPKGTVFEGKIHFHNLKKEELGLLLWAITWGNDKKLSHAVGMGKPYGFGQIKAEVSSLTYLNNDSTNNEYKHSSDDEIRAWEDAFEKYMENVVSAWKNSPQLWELKAMADPKNADRPQWDLSHLSLKNQFNKNEFVEAKSKKSKSFLAPYSESNQEKHLSGGGNSGYDNPKPRNNWNQGYKTQSAVPQRTPRSENGINQGSIQTCILLDGKTSKGGWKAKVKDNDDICGYIVNTSEVPSDKNAGDEIQLKIHSLKGSNTAFMYVK